MYSRESIKKVEGLMKARRMYYAPIAAERIAMAISNGNRKIGRVMNVSLPPIISSLLCIKTKHEC